MRPVTGAPELAIGLDLGGTKLGAVLLDGEARLIASSSHRHTLTGAPLEAVAARLLAAIAELEQLAGKTASVGLAVAASVGPTGELLASPNLAAPRGLALRTALEARLARPVTLVNDGNAFLQAELAHDPFLQQGLVFAVVLGTGVGGAIAAEGRLVEGARGVAGEWGHQPPPWEADVAVLEEPCGCGRRGCIDATLSGPGWLSDYQRLGGSATTTEALVLQFRAGETLARLSVARYRNRLARALAAVANVLDPVAIILGGGLAAVEELSAGLEPELASWRFGSRESPPLISSRLGPLAASIGAALLGRTGAGRPVCA